MKRVIATIQIGTRHRRDMGDLKELAESIRRVGLIQPIVVTAADVLVDGERRLRACRDILGLAEIEAHVIDINHLLERERDANEVRKQFTAEERVGIARAIKSELEERRGRNNPQNIAELRGRETRDIAAQKSGFGNPETLRQAETVVTTGTRPLIDAMNSGDISVSAAATLTELPAEEQAKVVKDGTAKQKAAELRKAKAEAHKRAMETAKQSKTVVIDEYGKEASPFTPEESAANEKELAAFAKLHEAMEVFVLPPLQPAEWLSLAPKYAVRNVGFLIGKMSAWMGQLEKEASRAKTA